MENIKQTPFNDRFTEDIQVCQRAIDTDVKKQISYNELRTLITDYVNSKQLDVPVVIAAISDILILIDNSLDGNDPQTIKFGFSNPESLN